MRAGFFLVVVLAMDIMLFLSQTAIVNLGGTTSYYGGSTLSNDLGNSDNYTLNTDDVNNLLPVKSNTIDETTGNVFTDLFGTSKTWLLDSTGLGFMLNILSGPYSFIRMIGAPNEISYAIGVFWYGITLFALVSWLLGRE